IYWARATLICSRQFYGSSAIEPESDTSRPLSRFIGSGGRSVVCGMTVAPFLAVFSLPICKPFKCSRSFKVRKVPKKCGMTHRLYDAQQHNFVLCLYIVKESKMFPFSFPIREDSLNGEEYHPTGK